jgi:hypothetical protein
LVRVDINHVPALIQYGELTYAPAFSRLYHTILEAFKHPLYLNYRLRDEGDVDL